MDFFCTFSFMKNTISLFDIFIGYKNSGCHRRTVCYMLGTNNHQQYFGIIRITRQPSSRSFTTSSNDIFPAVLC